MEEIQTISMPDPGYDWYVAHARPRAEKRIARECERKGYLYYLPLRKSVKNYGGRKRSFTAPVFPNYVFVQCSEANRQWIRQNRYVANLLEVVHQEKLVYELNQLASILAEDAEFDIHDHLHEGVPVKVLSGALAGTNGVVVKLHQGTRVIVNIEMINQSISVNVKSEDLELLNE